MISDDLIIHDRLFSYFLSQYPVFCFIRMHHKLLTYILTKEAQSWCRPTGGWGCVMNQLVLKSQGSWSRVQSKVEWLIFLICPRACVIQLLTRLVQGVWWCASLLLRGLGLRRLLVVTWYLLWVDGTMTQWKGPRSLCRPGPGTSASLLWAKPLVGGAKAQVSLGWCCITGVWNSLGHG